MIKLGKITGSQGEKEEAAGRGKKKETTKHPRKGKKPTNNH